jgi:GT2 family glycosyltransferase
VSGSGSGSGGRPLTVVYYAPEYHSNDGSRIQARAVFAHLPHSQRSAASCSFRHSASPDGSDWSSSPGAGSAHGSRCARVRASRSDSTEGRAVPASVVIVSYNSAHRLRACLDALRGVFDLTSDQVIVVDNHSSDDSVAVAEAACPEAVVIPNAANVGFARAVDQAIGVATGDHVVLVNPDVHSVTGSLARVHELLARPDVAAVTVSLTDNGVLQRSCRTTQTPMTIIGQIIRLNGLLPDWHVSRNHEMLDWDMAHERDVDYACGALLFLSRRAIERVGPFDERFFLYSEEADWLRRAKEAGLRTVYTPTVRAIDEANHNSAGSDNAELDLLLADSYFTYVRKWNGILAELGLRAALALIDAAHVAAGVASSPRARPALRRVAIDLGRRPRHPGEAGRSSTFHGSAS